MKAKLRRDYKGNKKGEVIEVTSEEYRWLELRKRIEPYHEKVDKTERKTKIDPEVKSRKKK